MVDLKRQEALANEYKGNLFEFLVGVECARFFDLEVKFLESITPEFQGMLAQQESMLRNFYPELIAKLPLFAQNMAKDIMASLELKRIDDIYIVGKSLSATADSDYAEADLIFVLDDKKYPISVKLSKMHAFVNTKSAGMRSFFSKYFSSDFSPLAQKEFNVFVDSEYESFALSLHYEAGIEFSSGFKNWEKSGLPVLPGELEGEYRAHLLNYYRKMNEKLFHLTRDMYDDDKDLFIKSLYALMGFSNSEVIQATLYYHTIKEELTFQKSSIQSIDIFKDTDACDLEFKMNETNFEIYLKEQILQVRLKPMNKFTSQSFKVNCSVKSRRLKA